MKITISQEYLIAKVLKRKKMNIQTGCKRLQITDSYVWIEEPE